MSPARLCLSLSLSLVILLAFTPASPAQSQTTPTAQPTGSADGPRFFSESTVLYTGRSAVLPFQVAEADPQNDRTFRARITGPAQIIQAPEVLAGHTTGFLRVRPKPDLKRPAQATLRLGDATLTLDLRPHPEVLAPKILTPITGAAVWGTLAVAVEWPTNPDQPHLDQAQPVLHIDRARTLKPIETTQLQNAPYRQAVFSLDTQALPPGTVQLTPVLQHANRALPDTPGRTITLRVVRPQDADLLIREAEAPNPQDQPIPERYRQNPPHTAEDESASGGTYVIHHGNQPVQTHPLNIDSPGWYQLVLRARGTPASAILPSVGFRVDNANRRLTQSRIAHTDWHRIPIGRPVLLKPEHRTLVPYYENDYARGRGNDRNLHVDRIELLRLGDADDQPQHLGPNHPASPKDLGVAFNQVWQGQRITGDLQLPVYTHIANAKSQPPGTVELRLNGSPVATQTDYRPRFSLPHQLLKTGTNTLQLHIQHPNLGHAASPVHTVTVLTQPTAETSATDPQPVYRFPLTDPRWTSNRKLHRDKAAGSLPVLPLRSNGKATLDLPPELEGRFNLVLDARGDHFTGPPLAEFALEQDDNDRVLEPFPVAKGYHTKTVGPIVLQRGPKQLTVAFNNDLYDAAKGDRNLFVRAIELRPVRLADTTAPQGSILYPKPDALLAVADAVVIEAREDRRLRSAEVLLNGEPVGLNFNLPRSQARHLLHLPLRDIPDGSHELTVRLTDTAGNTSTTPAVRIQTQHAPADQPTDYQRAVHLLNRFAFGVDAQQLADLLTLGPNAYLQQQLLHPEAHLQPPTDQLATTNLARTRFPSFGNHYHLMARGLTAALASHQPVRHRFILFANNHFNTWARKTGGDLKALEYRRFAALGAAPFTDLLLASATSPAMIHYLDQQNSRNKRINENYARELMELHTLGVHGGYSQQDVTNLARLLTGWTLAREGQFAATTYRYDPIQAQPDGQNIFGLRLDDAPQTERYDRIRHAIFMLARHPATARYFATKLAEHYTQTPADPDLVDHLAQTFHATGGDSAQMLLALAQHPAFTEAIRTPRLAHPVPYALGLSRAAGSDNPHVVDQYLNGAGNRLFDRETPDGYPDTDPDYADSNAFMQRWQFAHKLRWQFANTVPYDTRNPPEDAKPGSDEYNAWADRLIDLLALRLTGNPLSPRSHTAARMVLDQAQTTGYERLKTLGTFIAQTPEASLR